MGEIGQPSTRTAVAHDDGARMNIHLRDGSTTEDTRLGRLVEADPRTRSYPVRALMPVKTTRARSYTWSIGTILDQGSTSSCVGHAVAHRLIARPVVRFLHEVPLRERP